MKRYVSLASAILVGTVVANEKKTSTLAVKAVESKAVRAAAPAGVQLEMKKPIYASDVSDLDDNNVDQDVQIQQDSIKSEKTSARDVAQEEKKSAQSSATSARDVAQKENKSAQSSATSARVAQKEDDSDDDDDSKDSNDVQQQDSITTTPDDVF